MLDLAKTNYQERLDVQAVNQPCMLVYTSGTTGDPKGVMLSQVLSLILDSMLLLYHKPSLTTHSVMHYRISMIKEPVLNLLNMK